MPTRHVIIGAGPAGMNALATIRQLETEASEITLITDERAYSRMVLPYYLAGQIPEAQVDIGDEVYFARLNVKTICGRRVTAIKPEGNEVVLDDESTVPYDDLLIATGSSAVGLDVAGSDLAGVTNLWTLQDTQQALAAGKGEGTEAVFIGAGFIGFIILNAAYKAGWKLSVVEAAEQVLPRMLDQTSAGLVEKWLTDKNATVYTGTAVSAITAADEGKKVVQLQDGRELSADLVVMATGIRPNLELVAETGIETNEGILVDDRMRTNIPNIYAAGDVAEGADLLSGANVIHAIQPTAVDHGRVAGANMAGREVMYAGSLLINILDVCGLQCASFGQWSDDADSITIVNQTRPIYRKLVWRDDVLTGAIFVGPADDSAMLNDLGMVKGLIQTQAALGNWKEYLHENPFDIRRPYVASQAAAKLLEMSVTGQAGRERGYRHDNLPPTVRPNPHHALFVESIVL